MPIRTLLGFSILVTVAVAALAVQLVWRDAGPAEAYSPAFSARFCNGLSAGFAGSDPELAGSTGCIDPVPIPAASVQNLTTEFTLGGADGNNGSPLIQNVAGTVSADAAITNGSKIGGISWDVSLSFLNGSCSTFLSVDFVLYDSSTVGTVAVDPPSTPNRFASLVTDLNSDGRADSTSPFVGANPDMYPPMFTPNGGAAIPAKARYSGATLVATRWILISVFVFDAGALDAFSTNPDDLPDPLGRVSHAPTTGAITVTQVDGIDVQSPSTMSDVCGPQAFRTMLLGQTAGAQVRYTTPAAGTTGISAFTYSRRNDDGDAFDNYVDTCPFTNNLGVDPDGDGIDSACDPSPVFDSNFADHDGDTFNNRQDNCPLVANVSQDEGELASTYIESAPDGGPKVDGIGAACDPNPLTAHTEGPSEARYNFVAKCIGAGPDADLDGYCSLQDPADGNPAVTGFPTNQGMDQEYTMLSGGTAKQGDGVGGGREQYFGTDPVRNCPSTYVANDEATDAHPFDFDDDGEVDQTDILYMQPYLGQAVPPAPARFDISPNKVINISDVLAILPGISASQCLGTPPVNDGPVAQLALDVDTTGNDARLTGGASIQTCGSILSGASTTVDVLVPAPGIVASDGLSAVEFDLAYDSAIFSVTAMDALSYLVDEAPGSVTAVYAPVPDSDGLFEPSVVDTSSPDLPEGAGSHEVGPGVLVRITLQAVGTGQSSLVLMNPRLISADGEMMEISSVTNAAIAVAQACAPISPEDADGDGIEDVNDTSPLAVSTGFRDEHGGAPTTGSITSTAGATVVIADAPDGAAVEGDRGVTVTVTGPGGPVVITYCGETLTLTAPSTSTVTCGSAWLVLTAGGGTFNMGTYTGTVSSVTVARFTKVTTGTYDIWNHFLSAQSMNIGGLVIPVNTTVLDVKDSDADGIVDQVDLCPSFATAWVVPTGDTDCDGHPDTVTSGVRGRESFMGTDPTDRCADTTTLFDEEGPAVGEPISPWPPDINDSGRAELGDVVAFGLVLNGVGPTWNKSFGQSGYNPRMDLSAGPGSGATNISDIVVLGAYWNKLCTP